MEFVSTPVMVLGVAMFIPHETEQQQKSLRRRNTYGANMFTQEMDDILRARYPYFDTDEVAKEIGVTPKQCRDRACALGVGKALRAGKWTTEMDRTLKQRYPKDRTEDIAKDIGVTVNAVHQRAFKLKIVKDQEVVNRIKRENQQGGRR